MKDDDLTGDLFATPDPEHARKRVRRDDCETVEAAARIDQTGARDRAWAWLRSRGYLGGTTLEYSEQTGADRACSSTRFTELERDRRARREVVGFTLTGRVRYKSRVGSSGVRSCIWWAIPPEETAVLSALSPRRPTAALSAP